MAKALMGHVGFALDTRAANELRQLRERVRRLEADNAELRHAKHLLEDEIHDLRLHQEMLALAADGAIDVGEAAQPALA